MRVANSSSQIAYAIAIVVGRMWTGTATWKAWSVAVHHEYHIVSIYRWSLSSSEHNTLLLHGRGAWWRAVYCILYSYVPSARRPTLSYGGATTARACVRRASYRFYVRTLSVVTRTDPTQRKRETERVPCRVTTAGRVLLPWILHSYTHSHMHFQNNSISTNLDKSHPNLLSILYIVN